MYAEARESYSMKFDHPFSAWLYDQEPDDQTGDADMFGGWYGLYGRRIMLEQSQGFVAVDRFPTREAARERFDEIGREYADWNDPD